MAFNGKYYKGYMKHVRAIKREEAEARNAPKPTTTPSPENPCIEMAEEI